MATPRTFTKKGGSVPFSQGSARLAQIGRFDPETGTVYAVARRTLNGGLESSGRVRITQPRASTATTARRTPSVGMGGALSARREF